MPKPCQVSSHLASYMFNGNALIHYLMFAVDSFPGVAALDNLGLPESGDGISDVLQEAKWEADFLAKLQDTDGGFYFLVYPRERDYENDVLPDDGDPQVVWPKTTAVTAAAVAALAQTASSPRFKQHYPATASLYLQKAQLGWKFLTNAIALHGKDGSYQKITHYGDKMMHDDELAWAACEMFVATGHPSYQQKLIEWFNPSDPDTWQYGWWHMFESYGSAIRSFAFAARSGKLSANQLDPIFLAKCETEILKSGNDTLLWAQQNAYGSSFPSETKRFFTAGFYFSSDQAFDITVAYQLDPRSDYLDAILSNLNYEGGCNPVNITYVTGLGAKRQREVVHQFAQNDRRVLPQSGLPLGNIQSGFDYLDLYGLELGNLCFPPDGADSGAYPFYDRWGDSFNVTTEFVVLNQARSLASLAFLATLTSAKTQAWVSAAGQIAVTPAVLHIGTPVTATFQAPGLELSTARIVWEARDQQPVYGSNTFTFVPVSHGTQWVEVEAHWPDGRRVFAAANFLATNDLPTVSIVATDPNAAERNADPGVFTFTRTGNSSKDLRIHFEYGGTATIFDDYRTEDFTVPDSVLIPAGARTTTLTFYPIDDVEVEGPETVTLTLQPDPAYNVSSPRSALFTIADDNFDITTIVRANDGIITLQWTSIIGCHYRVLFKNNLNDFGWQPLAPVLQAVTTNASWSDQSAPAASQRFYQVMGVR